MIIYRLSFGVYKYFQFRIIVHMSFLSLFLLHPVVLSQEFLNVSVCDRKNFQIQFLYCWCYFSLVCVDLLLIFSLRGRFIDYILCNTIFWFTYKSSFRMWLIEFLVVNFVSSSFFFWHCIFDLVVENNLTNKTSFITVISVLFQLQS